MAQRKKKNPVAAAPAAGNSKDRRPVMVQGKKKKLVAAGPAAGNSKDSRRMSNAERSAYFARREAAKVLRTVLQGDARQRASGTIKSLVYSPSVRNKKGTFALVCQTLKRKLAAALVQCQFLCLCL